MARTRRTRKRPRSPAEDRGWLVPPLLFLWTLVVHLSFLAGSAEPTGPAGLLFVGDAPELLENAQLLLHPPRPGTLLPPDSPLTLWLLAGLWRAFTEPALVQFASKALMAVFNGLFFALLYVVLRERLSELAAPICFLLPLSFPEILLSSAASSEVVYRLLLLVLISLGWRLPVFAGVLHAAAVLTRPEHLAFAATVALASFVVTPRRRLALLGTGLVTVALLVPWWHRGSQELRAFNAQHRGAAFEPRSEIPYPPPRTRLDFHLAQGGEQLYFFLPSPLAVVDGSSPTPADTDPHFPRLLEKSILSLRVVGSGWSWRDFPKRGTWVRRPRDLAFAAGPLYLIFVSGLAALGLWALRRDRGLLGLAAVLLSYRLAFNSLFTPLLPSMAVVLPLLLLFVLVGAATLFGRFARRGLFALLALLALLHLPSALRPRHYLLRERNEPGVAESSLYLVFQGYRSPVSALP